MKRVKCKYIRILNIVMMTITIKNKLLPRFPLKRDIEENKPLKNRIKDITKFIAELDFCFIVEKDVKKQNKNKKEK